MHVKNILIPKELVNIIAARSDDPTDLLAAVARAKHFELLFETGTRASASIPVQDKVHDKTKEMLLSRAKTHGYRKISKHIKYV